MLWITVVLQDLGDNVLDGSVHPGVHVHACGFKAQIKSFSFFLRIRLGHLIISHADNLRMCYITECNNFCLGGTMGNQKTMKTVERLKDEESFEGDVIAKSQLSFDIADSLAASKT